MDWWGGRVEGKEDKMDMSVNANRFRKWPSVDWNDDMSSC